MAFDIAILGAGVAGASVAAFLTHARRVAILEAETHPGYHTTGRSAAFYAQTYGGPGVQPLTTASMPFLSRPPDGLVDHTLLSPRGALYVAQEGDRTALDALEAGFAGAGVRLEQLDGERLRQLAPQLRTEWTRGLWEPDCQDIDVAALHAGLLRLARANGATLLTGARVEQIERTGPAWRLTTSTGERIEAGILVNAAGAWADQVATRAGVAPLSITPLRRTIVQLDVAPSPSPTHPLTLDVHGNWYFKPDSGRIWLSPHDETPDVAHDVQPDELDVAIAIDRFETATTFRVKRLERAWAGLRCFAPDRLPVLGWDAHMPAFFWCAGQGGFGIQTAPATGMLCAALLEARELSADLIDAGVDPLTYAPSRLASGAPSGARSAA